MIIHHLLPSGKLTCHHFSIGDTDRYRYIFQGWMFFHCHVEFSAGGSSGRGRTVFAVISPSGTLVITISFIHRACKFLFLPLGRSCRLHQSTKISFFMLERLCHQTSPDSMFLTFSSSWFSIFDNSQWYSATFYNMTSMTPPTLSSCGIWLSFKIANIHAGDSMVKNWFSSNVWYLLGTKHADSIPNQFVAKPNEPKRKLNSLTMETLNIPTLTSTSRYQENSYSTKKTHTSTSRYLNYDPLIFKLEVWRTPLKTNTSPEKERRSSSNSSFFRCYVSFTKCMLP